MFSWHFLEWLSLLGWYVISIAELGGGGYLALFIAGVNPFAKPLRYVGFVLIAAGLITGAFTFGRQIGGGIVEAAWQQKDYESQIAALKRDMDAKQVAADTAAAQAQQLASQNDDLQKQVSDYQDAAAHFDARRRATADDVRRLCNIVGNSAPGCQHSK
jgi:hypothetical protein